MAAPPFLPAEIEALRVTPDSSPCAKATSAAKTTDALAALWAWMMNADGTIADAYKEWVGTGGGGTSGTSDLVAPSGVTATSDRSEDIKVTWGSVAAATQYTVYRSLSSDTATMEAITGPLSVLTYNDVTTAGTHYFYAVKASNALLNSGFSAVAEGVRIAGTGFTPITYADSTTRKDIIVPALANRMELRIWGGGNIGGTNSVEGWVVSGTPLAFGGGGGSGAFLRVEGITVVAGEVYVLDVGKSAQPSSVYKATFGSANFATAPSGGAGGNGRSFNTQGVAGAAAASYGSSTLVGGTVNSTDSNVGNPGLAGGAGGAGGAAVTYGGALAGAGGNGNNIGVNYGGAPTPGNPGQIVVIFTAV